MGSVNILLSYRRADASGMAGRIFDRLSQHYGPGRVFIDIDNIPMGVDFHDHLEAALADCGVLLALIGPKWIGRRPGKPARIHDEDDWVRVEVEKAFALGVPVIPVLLEGATLPKKDSLPASLQPLLRRNGVSIDSGRDFHAHLSRLCNGIDGLLASFNRGAARQADCDGLEEMPTVASMDPASAPVAPAASTDKPEGAHDSADVKRASSPGSSSVDDMPAGATAETDTSGTVNDAERAAPKPTGRAPSRRFSFSDWYDQKERGARWRAVWGSTTALLVLLGLVGTWLAARTGEFGSAQTALETSGGVASNAPTQASVTSTPSETPAAIGKAPESAKPKETSVPPPTPEANRSIRSYLIGKGIPASIISTSSAGASAPPVETADGVREQQNRRVEITTR